MNQEIEQREGERVVASRCSSRGLVMLQTLGVAMLAFVLYGQSQQRGDLETQRDQSAEQAAAIATLDLHVRDRLGDQTAAIATLERQVHDLRAVISHITGEVLPIAMPDGWEAELVRLSGMVDQPAQWPSNAAAAETYLGRLRALVQKTPRWAEDHFIDRLDALRWAAQAFAALAAPAPSDWSEFGVHVSDLQAVRVAAPDNADSQLLRALDERIAAAERDLPDRFHKGVTAQATGLLREVGAGRRSIASDELQEVLLRLQLLEQDAEVEGLIAGLSNELFQREVRAQLPNLRKRFDALHALDAGSSDLQEHGLHALNSEVVSLRIALQREGLSENQLSRLGDEIGRALSAVRLRQAEAQSLRWRRYQEWALDQMRYFEHQFSRQEREANDRALIGKIGRKWTEDEYKGVTDAALTYLLVIEPTLLEWLPHKQYELLMTKAWTTLDEKDAQTQRRRLITESVTKQRCNLDNLEQCRGR